jgi:CxxC-x17-CxxC domain-containing protein
MAAMAERADKHLTCKDCRRVFLFTLAEQDDYAARGYLHPPSRCPECRAARGARKQERGASAGRALTCAKCGARTRVPFVPRTQKPIYCRSCLLEMRGR